MHAAVSPSPSDTPTVGFVIAGFAKSRSAGAHLRRFAARSLCIAAAATALACGVAGCSPRYDWRGIVNEEAGYSAMFPAKPANDKRHIVVDGQSFPMQMQQANGGDAVFAVGVVTLPEHAPGQPNTPADSALRAKVLDFLRTGLASNFSSSPATATPISINSTPPLLGWAWQATGSAPGRHESRHISARFFATGRRVYEVAVISNDRLPDEQVEQFFDAFHPL